VDEQLQALYERELGLRPDEDPAATIKAYRTVAAQLEPDDLETAYQILKSVEHLEARR
jgi:hypothetical protein